MTTQAQARQICRAIGITFARTPGENEFRVAPDQHWNLTLFPGRERNHRREELASYETDIDSAIATARALAAWLMANVVRDGMSPAEQNNALLRSTGIRNLYPLAP